MANLIDRVRECRVYGPYKSRKRLTVQLREGQRTTLSYAKWIMEQHLGRVLEKGERVIHADRDTTNYDLENLRLVRSAEKLCRKCYRIRLRSDFWKSTKDGVQGYCKECLGAENRSNRNENRRVVMEYLYSHPCVDCGEEDPVVLDFDHIEGKGKICEVGRMLSSGYSLKAIMEEIAKCEVRCANCHRRKTARSRGWYKWL